jgi:hypothetical protein
MLARSGVMASGEAVRNGASMLEAGLATGAQLIERAWVTWPELVSSSTLSQEEDDEVDECPEDD